MEKRLELEKKACVRRRAACAELIFLFVKKLIYPGSIVTGIKEWGVFVPATESRLENRDKSWFPTGTIVSFCSGWRRTPDMFADVTSSLFGGIVGRVRYRF